MLVGFKLKPILSSGRAGVQSNAERDAAEHGVVVADALARHSDVGYHTAVPYNKRKQLPVSGCSPMLDYFFGQSIGGAMVMVARSLRMEGHQHCNLKAVGLIVGHSPS
jgi:hypothetical protein